MEFRTVDFEKLTKHYKVWREGHEDINKLKNTYLSKLEPTRKRMEEIIKAEQSGIVTDNKSQKERMQEFQQLQQQAQGIEMDYKKEFKHKKDELNTTVYDKLEEIISKWSKENNIDIVIGKMEVVYCTDKYEITEEILEVLKNDDLWIEWSEEEQKEIENEKR